MLKKYKRNGVKKMKKYLIILLAIMLSITAWSLAEESKEYIRDVYGLFDIEMSLTDGYYIWELYNENENTRIRYGMESLSENGLYVYIDICRDDTLTNIKTMNDMTEEDLLLLKKTFDNAEEKPYYIYTDDGIKIMCIKWKEEEREVLTYLTVYESCMIEITAENTEFHEQNKQISEDCRNSFENILKTIKFEETYMSLGENIRINDTLKNTWNAEYEIRKIAEETGKNYVPVYTIANDNDRNIIICLIKDNDTKELLLMKIYKNKEITYEILNYNP